MGRVCVVLLVWDVEWMWILWMGSEVDVYGMGCEADVNWMSNEVDAIHFTSNPHSHSHP